MVKTKPKTFFYRSKIGNNILAGRKSHASNPLFRDFILIARKLEKFGFIYHRGSVIIVDSSNKQNT